MGERLQRNSWGLEAPGPVEGAVCMAAAAANDRRAVGVAACGPLDAGWESDARLHELH